MAFDIITPVDPIGFVLSRAGSWMRRKSSNYGGSSVRDGLLISLRQRRTGVWAPLGRRDDDPVNEGGPQGGDLPAAAAS